jgi:hypothetical protein
MSTLITNEQICKDLVAEVLRHLQITGVNTIHSSKLIKLYILSGDYRWTVRNFNIHKYFIQLADIKDFFNEHEPDYVLTQKDIDELFMIDLLREHVQEHKNCPRTCPCRPELECNQRRIQNAKELMARLASFIETEIDGNPMYKGFNIEPEGEQFELTIPQTEDCSEDFLNRQCKIKHRCEWETRVRVAAEKAKATRNRNEMERLKKKRRDIPVNLGRLEESELVELKQRASKMKRATVEKMALSNNKEKELLGLKILTYMDLTNRRERQQYQSRR